MQYYIAFENRVVETVAYTLKIVIFLLKPKGSGKMTY